MGGAVNIVSVPKFDNLEVLKTGKTVLSKPASSTGTSIFVTHNLGFKPVVIAYLDFGEFERHPLPFFEIANSGADTGKIQSFISFSLGSDDDMVFYINTPDWAANGWYSGAFDIDITYYLCRVRTT